MINTLCQEINNHWKAGDISFVSSVNFRSSAIRIFYDHFKADSKIMHAVMMELSRQDGHKAQQEIVMGTQDELNRELNSPAFRELIQKRLDTLHESIEEMYD